MIIAYTPRSSSTVGLEANHWLDISFRLSLNAVSVFACDDVLDVAVESIPAQDFLAGVRFLSLLHVRIHAARED